MDENDLVNKIEHWIGDFGLQSEEGTVIESFLYYLKEYTFRDEIGEHMDKVHIRVFFRDRVLFRIYMNGHQHWFDDISTLDMTETRDDIALKAMQSALAMTKGKSWGEFQHLTMAHPMSQVPVISGLLGLERGPFPRAGNPGTLNATTSLPDGDGRFKAMGGPSWRFLIDFADVDNVHMVIPSGQSGNPMDPHFFDFYELWATGNYWTIPLNKQAVMKAKKTVLELIPNNLSE